MSEILLRWMLALAACACADSTAALTYPTKPIRLVVGLPPGGSVDIVARAVDTQLQQTFGQTMIIENRAGGGLAAEVAAKSPPTTSHLSA